MKEFSFTETQVCKCHICGKTMFHSVNLITHIKRVHQKAFEHLFKCDQCGRHFSTQKGFDYHMMTHAGEFPFPCGICPKKFRDKTQFKTHLESEHLRYTHDCQECFSKFVSEAGLREHMRRGHKYVCDKCGGRFTNLRYLKIHLIKQLRLKGKLPKCFVVLERLSIEGRSKISR